MPTTNFPTSLDNTSSLPNPGSGNFTDNPSHAGQHDIVNDAVKAVEAKVGIGASTPVANRVFRGTGTGTSAWAQLVLTTDVTGTLPVANGGTGVTTSTGTGNVVLSSSPTITTPTIASFTNATHTHTNAAGGGTLGAAAVPALDYSAQTLFNPYKFSVYRSAAWTSGTPGLVQFDTKIFDTNGNVDIVTNKGRYTVPIAGFYYFSAGAGCATGNGSFHVVYLYKNSANFYTGTQWVANGTNQNQGVVSGLVQLAANDYVEVYVYDGAAGRTSSTDTYFQGFLVCTT